MGGKECDDLLAELSDLLHGDLPEHKRASLHRHLEECPPCMETADFQAQLKQLVAKRCCEDVPAGLRDRIAGLFAAGSAPDQAIP